MGLIQDIWKKVNGSEEEPEEDIPDDITRDKYLRSLRRENRVMDEAEEKEYLKKKIAARRKAILRRDLFGIKDKIEKKQEQNHSFYGRSNL